MNYTALCVERLISYSLRSTCWICFYILEHSLKIHVLGLSNLAWSSSFLRTEWNFLNHLVIILWSIVYSPFMYQMFLVVSVALWPSSNFWNLRSSWITLACSSMLLSNPTCCKAMHLSPHQLLQSYQPQWIPSTALIALGTWHKCHKLVSTKKLQNFWLTLVLLIHPNISGLKLKIL